MNDNTDEEKKGVYACTVCMYVCMFKYMYVCFYARVYVWIGGSMFSSIRVQCRRDLCTLYMNVYKYMYVSKLYVCMYVYVCM